MIEDIIQAGIEEIKGSVNADFFAGKNALVTGGAGFIGSWLCDALVGLGAGVTIVDNFSTGRIKNIDHLLSNRHFRLTEANVQTLDNKQAFDIIFHMAAHASPDEYMAHPIRDTSNQRSRHHTNIAE